MNPLLGKFCSNTIFLVFILQLVISTDQLTSSVELEPDQSGNVLTLDFLNQTDAPWTVSPVDYSDWFAYLDNLDEMPDEARDYFKNAEVNLGELVDPADGIWATLFSSKPPIVDKPYPKISFHSAAYLMEYISIKYFIYGNATIVICIGSSENACTNVTTFANQVLSNGWSTYEDFSLTGAYGIELQVHEDGGFILIDKIQCTPSAQASRPPPASTTLDPNATTTTTTTITNSTVTPQWPTTNDPDDGGDGDGPSSATRPHYIVESKFCMLICILSFFKL